MNLALFGGTFDPVHHGHLELARRAAQRFQLQQVLFVPASVPPHKQREPLTAFEHRYAMLALATADEKAFLPSLLESPAHGSGTHPADAAAKRHTHSASVQHHAETRASYSIDTVRRLKRRLRKSDRLFFLIGIDAFLDIATWKDPEALLRECEFIVGSRPGYTLADVAGALPASLRPPKEVTKPFGKQPAAGELVFRGVHLQLLEGVSVPVSATQVRLAASSGRALGRLVPARVAEYIKKMRLYRDAERGSAKRSAGI
jgi:nicotinate-nucleotide adenylyltransferase